MKIKNKDAPPSCVMFSRLNLKPKKLTPNFKTGSEASQIPFSKDFLFDRLLTDIPMRIANKSLGVE